MESAGNNLTEGVGSFQFSRKGFYSQIHSTALAPV